MNEYEFSIIPQPDPTCPIKDDIEQSLNNLSILNKRLRTVSPVESLAIMDEVNDWLTEASISLEKYKEEVCKIREWGQQWKDKSQELLIGTKSL